MTGKQGRVQAIGPATHSGKLPWALAAAPSISHPTPPGRLTPSAGSPLPGLGPGPEEAADLDGLSVVDFYHVEVKTVDSFARGDESAAF